MVQSQRVNEKKRNGRETNELTKAKKKLGKRNRAQEKERDT